MLNLASAAERLALLGRHLHDRVGPVEGLDARHALFLSVSDGDRRARVVTATGETFEEAWRLGAETLLSRMKAEGLRGRWIRVDWPSKVVSASWGEVRRALGGTKRNYFRHGLALDAGFERAFTEQELNANAAFYGGNTVESAVLNEKNFAIYAAQQFPGGSEIDFSDEAPVFVFDAMGAFCDETGQVLDLEEPGLNTGRRKVAQLDEPHLHAIIHDASAYLASQVQPDGSFVYGYHPCFDRRIDAYNALRHASTTYSMIEAWEVTRDVELKAAIDRAVRHLTDTLIREAYLPDWARAAFLVDIGDEVKLGGSAVAILALAKLAAVTRSDRHHGLMERLAAGIRFMQDEKTGAFTHVLDFPGLAVKQPFRTIYYEGEAAFALMRLYGLTGDERWLAIVEKAFAHFIAQEHWQHHDHWLGYCVNELTRHRPDEHYLRFGLRNVAGYLDFVETRITTFPTLLELMMAARETLSRIDSDPSLHHLLQEIDLPHFERALEARAHYLLNGHFWPELAMYYRNPDRIVGSFFIRHHGFRVRIDDVEHYLSGLVAYRRYLGEREAFRALVARHPKLDAAPSSDLASRGWTAANVAAATGGEWVAQPPEGWSASGLSTHAPTLLPGQMAAMRITTPGVGIAPKQLARLSGISAVVTQDPDQVPVAGLPILKVEDVGQAVLALGRHARDRMTGRVTAVTGSAGKTTVVAMTAHALAASGKVDSSAHNANLPVGVAWNLASMDWDVPNVVLELAIGRMAVSSRMARPHVAIFTNVLPAHLGETSTLADIARTKSAIFHGMQPGDTAVLYRQMQERDLVEAAARRRKLDIVWYGEGESCDFRLESYDIESGIVRATARGEALAYRLGAVGRHMALNSLAVLAAVSAHGLPLEPALERLESFDALPGRGEQLAMQLGARHVTVIDDAYNANPGSMRAALDRLCDQRVAGRRIAVLSQMAELGPDAARYHTELARLIEARPIDRVYVTGELYDAFWERLPASLRGQHAPTLDALRECILDELRDGDTVLFKGSQSTRLHELVAAMKRQATKPSRPEPARSSR